MKELAHLFIYLYFLPSVSCAFQNCTFKKDSSLIGFKTYNVTIGCDVEAGNNSFPFCELFKTPNGDSDQKCTYIRCQFQQQQFISNFFNKSFKYSFLLKAACCTRKDLYSPPSKRYIYSKNKQQLI